MTTRIGTFCFRHAWWVLAGWLVVAIVGVSSFGPLFERIDDTDNGSDLESSVGRDKLDEGAAEGDSLVALVEPGDRSARTALASASTALMAMPGVAQVHEPTAPRTGDDVALQVVLTPDVTDGELAAAEQRLRAITRDLPGASIRIGGSAVLDDVVDDQVATDLANAEKYAMPITALALVVVFGGLVAAGLPLLGMIMTVLGAIGVLLGFSTFIGMEPSVVNVVTMLGMALSIDYGLLLVARYREELAVDPDRLGAVARTWRTAGRTVAFSGLTVAVALTSLLFVDLTFVQAIGSAGIATAVVAMAASLTLTPALLRLARGRVKARKRPLSDRGFFVSLARFTQRRPWFVVVRTAGVLLAITAPLLGTTFKMSGLDSLPADLEPVAVAQELDARYSGGNDPSIVVVSSETPASLDAWAAQWRDRVRAVEPAMSHGDVSSVGFVLDGDPASDEARDLVADMQADRPAGDSWVTGDAAEQVDIIDRLTADLPLVIGFAALGMFVLMFLMTGSVVIPLEAIAMTALSTGATFGLMVVVFDWGWLSGPLGTLPMDGVNPINLVMIFAFATALAMDYEMFLLGRIAELVTKGMPTDRAVREGMQRSGRLITSAALLMLIVYAGFSAAKIGDIEQIGIGLFTAVLIDATVVRCLLVPAIMTLLGRWNWWAPAILTRVHRRVGINEGEKELVSLSG